jgi:hypothetical protein
MKRIGYDFEKKNLFTRARPTHLPAVSVPTLPAARRGCVRSVPTVPVSKCHSRPVRSLLPLFLRLPNQKVYSHFFFLLKLLSKPKSKCYLISCNEFLAQAKSLLSRHTSNPIFSQIRQSLNSTYYISPSTPKNSIPPIPSLTEVVSQPTECDCSYSCFWCSQCFHILWQPGNCLLHQVPPLCTDISCSLAATWRSPIQPTEKCIV